MKIRYSPGPSVPHFSPRLRWGFRRRATRR